MVNIFKVYSYVYIDGTWAAGLRGPEVAHVCRAPAASGRSDSKELRIGGAGHLLFVQSREIP